MMEIAAGLTFNDAAVSADASTYNGMRFYVLVAAADPTSTSTYK
jgi:hypothetical protein